MRFAMNTIMQDTASSKPEHGFPTITVSRLLEMSTNSCRYKIELAISGVKFSNLAGKPVPHKTSWQHHPSITVLAQNVDGREITVEAMSDDMSWLQHLTKQLVLDKTVILEQPLFSGSR
jgi:hypothetical protein